MIGGTVGGGDPSMYALRRLRHEDEAAVLAFELENRAYFGQFVSDRGDEYFQRFGDHHSALLADQAAGVCQFHVLIDGAGAVVGRVNLYDLAHGSAVLGYRVAERVAGTGVATAAVTRIVAMAAADYGLQRLTAVVMDTNVASRRVLEKSGFVAVGPAQISGQIATRYGRDVGRSRPT